MDDGRSKVNSECDSAKLKNEKFYRIFLRPATAHGASLRLRLDNVLNNLVT